MMRSFLYVAVLLHGDVVTGIRTNEIELDIAQQDQPSLAETGGLASKPSKKTPFSHWFNRHNFQIDAASEEAKLRGVSDIGILQTDERVKFAFKVGSCKTYLTSKRFIFRWKKLFSPRTEYRSMPYSAIKAWSIETTGRWPDAATRLRLWTSSPGHVPEWMAFRKGKADIFELGRFLGEQLGIMMPAEQQQLSTKSDDFKYVAEDFWSWWGGDLVQIEPTEAEKQLRRSAPFLGESEVVQKAFKVGSELFLFTSHRIIDAEVMGRAWQRSIRYTSVPWSHVQAYRLRTAGGVGDRDEELQIFTDIPGMMLVAKDLRNGRVDTQGILAYLNEKIVGGGNGSDSDAEVNRPAEVAPQSRFGDMMAWLGNDFSKVDPVEVEALIRKENPGALLQNEKVELGYRVFRDSFLLTNKRVLLVDQTRMLFSKPKVAYMTVPYSSIHAFSTTTSSGSWDRDSEFSMYTHIPRPPCAEEPCADFPARLSFDMRRGKANITEIQEYMTTKLFGAPQEGASCGGSLATKNKDSFFDWLLGDAREVPAQEAQDLFCSEGILQPGEEVDLAFQLRRDSTLYTKKRLINVNRHVFNKRRVTITSMGYSSLRYFDVKSAGGWLDRDHDLQVYTDLPAMPSFRQEFRKGSVDIFKIQKALLERLSGTGLPQTSLFQAAVQSSARSLTSTAAASLAEAEVDQAASLSFRNFVEMDAGEAERQLREEQILQDGETALMAFTLRRDRVVFTQRRMIFRDIPLVGQQIRYQTVPFSAVDLYAIQTGGKYDGHMEMKLWLESPGLPFWHMNFKRNGADIFKVGEFWNRRVLREPTSGDPVQ